MKSLSWILGLILIGALGVIGMHALQGRSWQTPVPIMEEVPRLSGTWVWQRTELNNGDVLTPSRTGVFTLTFTEAGAISGTTDCNSFAGTYALHADNAIAFSDFARTEMYCEDSQEALFLRTLSDITFMHLTEAGDLVLLIKFDSGAMIFARG